MKFMVGIQFLNDSFISCIEENSDSIYEAYFSWGDFPNGRNNQVNTEGYLQCELFDKQREVLKRLSDKKIALNLLLNGNCYGKDSLSRAFYEKIGNTVDYISENYGLSSITTTSPIIAKFIKNNFNEIEVRASVNMEIGTVPGMEYISEYFDSFYIKREYNRDFNRIKEMKNWCNENGKKLFMLANSGCLNFCSVHNFHDNLVAHETEISKMDNAYQFHGICREFLKKEENIKNLIDYTNFVRPEDIDKYDCYFSAAKLATRVNKNPSIILKSYVNKKYVGNILEILEPTHSIYPYVLENGETLKIVKIDDAILIE